MQLLSMWHCLHEGTAVHSNTEVRYKTLIVKWMGSVGDRWADCGLYYAIVVTSASSREWDRVACFLLWWGGATRQQQQLRPLSVGKFFFPQTQQRRGGPHTCWSHGFYAFPMEVHNAAVIRVRLKLVVIFFKTKSTTTLILFWIVKHSHGLFKPCEQVIQLLTNKIYNLFLQLEHETVTNTKWISQILELFVLIIYISIYHLWKCLVIFKNDMW